MLPKSLCNCCLLRSVMKKCAGSYRLFWRGGVSWSVGSSKQDGGLLTSTSKTQQEARHFKCPTCVCWIRVPLAQLRRKERGKNAAWGRWGEVPKIIPLRKFVLPFCVLCDVSSATDTYCKLKRKKNAEWIFLQLRRYAILGNSKVQWKLKRIKICFEKIHIMKGL